MARKKKKKGKAKVEADASGHFVWESYFIGGKRKRRKRRVTLIDGELVDDLDEWLLANADETTLHQMERWDLLEKQSEDGEPE